jgi:succinate dehydrogenase / fumarate reductase membrane anchor subunit
VKLLSGLRAWTVQRVSAVLLLGFVLSFGVYLLAAPPASYEEWRALVSKPATGVALAIFSSTLLAHAWVGVRDVVLDYVHSRPLKAVLLAGLAVALTTSGAGVLLALAGLGVH